MRGSHEHVCGCFPTGLHYPGIADRIARSVVGVAGLAGELDAAASWISARLVVIDFETTGLDPSSDRVLEMGLACFSEGKLERRHNWLVNPGVPVPEEARKVHGISDEDLAMAPRFEDAFSQAISHLDGRIPVAYNAEFDRRFFHAEFGRLGGALDVEAPPALRHDVVWIDPLVWVRELHKYEKGKKLTEVCARLGIEIGQAHRAADDAEATGRVLMTLAKDMPQQYGELIRIQKQYAARQEAEMAAWRSRRS
jgi:DNA polymerase-3 subunit epsilon